MKKIKTIILAAGEGKRMKSSTAKVLHRVAGNSLLGHVLEVAQSVDDNDIAVIVGHNKDEVIKTIPEDISVYIQEKQKGTGHAVMQASEFFSDSDATVVVLNGDAPLLRPETLEDMLHQHQKSDNAVTIMTAEVDEPTGYGRIIKSDGCVMRIVEERDASDDQRRIKEINAGTYCFDADVLSRALEKITTDNKQSEYYLTDTIEIIREDGGDIGAYCVADPTEIAAVNSRIQLAEAERIFRNRINTELMDNGVTIIAPENTYIDSTVKIGEDTIIYPGVILEGDTVIGSHCTIGMNTHLVNTKTADYVEIQNSTVLDSSIGSGTVVGPYAYIRPNSYIGKDTKIGDFVEIKNSVIGDGTKISHLTYVGDADVGKNVNLGCGTVFVNYDGVNKHRTVVEDDCFIGCNTNLVAPVTVKARSYTAAGSTITEDVPENTLAIARARQTNKVGYVPGADND